MNRCKMNDETTKLTRRQREKIAHSIEILDAAEECFIKLGFDNTTMEDIAKKAEFAVGSIYTFFKNKKELLESVIERILQKRIKNFHDYITPYEDDTMIAIEKLIANMVSFHLKYGDLFRISRTLRDQEQREKTKSNKITHPPKELIALFDEFHALQTSLFQKGIENGTLCDLSPDNLRTVFDGVIHSFMFRNEISGNKKSESELIKELTHIFKTILTSK